MKKIVPKKHKNMKQRSMYGGTSTYGNPSYEKLRIRNMLQKISVTFNEKCPRYRNENRKCHPTSIPQKVPPDIDPPESATRHRSPRKCHPTSIPQKGLPNARRTLCYLFIHWLSPDNLLFPEFPLYCVTALNHSHTPKSCHKSCPTKQQF